MTDIVNLNRFRKAKGKADKQAAAAANRVKFGRAKAEKARDAAETGKHRDAVEGAKLDEPPATPKPEDG